MENNIKVFGKYSIGDIVVRTSEDKDDTNGNIYQIHFKSTNQNLYYEEYRFSNICHFWRAATEVEIDAYNNGIRNIKDIPNFNDNGEMTNEELLEKAIGLFLELINKAKNIKL